MRWGEGPARGAHRRGETRERGSRRAAPRRGRALFAGLVALLAAGCGGGDAPASAEGGPDSGEHREASRSPVVLVTGSTDGLGRELALRLASTTGAHLIIHGRNEERGRDVVAEIEAEGVGSASFYRADFASLDQVRELADAIRRDFDRLDVLVNNAGVGPGAPGHERVITEDGHELRFQVNYLAGFLLTHELLPLLREGTPSRIVNVASRSQQPLDFADLRLDRGYTGSLAYGRSKLAQILFTLDLSEELAGTGVAAFAVHPAGAMDTGLVRETGGTPQTPVSRGVESVYRVITGEGLEGGTYFHELEPAPAHDQAYDEDARRRLREASERFVGREAGTASGAF
jgi:NAD(P)-dependent dehydrogenase (short-subunit alcohol dehydrogenase family)